MRIGSILATTPEFLMAKGRYFWRRSLHPAAVRVFRLFRVSRVSRIVV